MVNNFLNGVKNARNNMKVVEAEKVAKEIKQYGGLDVYKMMKDGQMYAIVVDDIVIGGATTKKDAQEALEFLKHFTQGKILDKNSLFMAQRNAMNALTQGHKLMEAEKEGVKITRTLTVDEEDYIIDSDNELYSIEGEHICNVADIVTALEEEHITEKLFNEVITSRIRDKRSEWAEEDDDEYYDDDDYDEYEEEEDWD